MIKKAIISVIVLIGLAGCSSYRNTPWVVYYYETNKMVESLVPAKGYSIYEFTSPFVGVADKEKHHPAHYQLLIPQQNDLKRLYRKSDNRCFVYSKARGIAIIQELYSWRKNYDKGLREISPEEAEGWLPQVMDMHETKFKIQKDRHHYLYVDHEIRIVLFNLSEKDYQDFVVFPLDHLKFYRRGEIRMTGNSPFENKR